MFRPRQCTSIALQPSGNNNNAYTHSPTLGKSNNASAMDTHIQPQNPAELTKEINADHINITPAFGIKPRSSAEQSIMATVRPQRQFKLYNHITKCIHTYELS